MPLNKSPWATLDLPRTAAVDYLGPGRVIEVRLHDLTVELRGGKKARAQMALSVPHAVAVGDLLLMLGKGEEHFVIGVLHGNGRPSLSLKGEVELRATGGPLTLSSDRGVAIRSPKIALEAGELRVLASSVVQTIGSLYRRVREALDVQAGSATTTVDDASVMTAKSATMFTEETMSLNGDEIHLG